METLREFLPFLIPILVIQIGLMVISWFTFLKIQIFDWEIELLGY